MTTRLKKIPGLSSDNEVFRDEMKTLIKEVINALATHVKVALQNALSKIFAL